MSDEQLNIDFQFNTSDAKRNLKEIEDATRTVNETTEKGNKPLKEREGIIERLKRRITELRAEQEKLTSVSNVAHYNKELQSYEQELVRISRAGRSGFDAHGQAMLSNEGILQRLQRAALLYQKGMQEATRVENIEKYSQKLALVNAEMNKLTKGGNVSGTGWNGLQNSINQIGRELPAITYGFQTFAVGISNNLPIFADEIARLRRENELLSASGQKGVPIWKQIVSGLFSWQTALTVGITLLTVYGKEIGNFFKTLLTGKASVNQAKVNFEALNNVMTETAKSAAKEIAQLKVLSSVAQDVTKSTKERKEAVKQLQELGKDHNIQLKTEAILAGEAAAQYRELAKSIMEAARSQAAMEKIKTIEQKRLDLEFQRQKVQNANTNEKARYVRQGDDPDQTVSNGVFGTNVIKGLTVSEKQLGSDIRATKAIKEIESEMKVLDKTSEFLLKFVKIEEEKKKIKKGGTGLENLYRQLSDSSKDVLDKIQALDSEYASQLLSSDEAEKQALRDKFADFRKIIEEENEKIIAYNKKNKKNVPLLNVEAVNPIEQRASEQLDYTQNTARLQKQYDEEYKVFVEYQKLKEEANAEYADKRFADDLEKIKSFETRLNNEIASIDPKTTNGLEKKRLEELLKLQKDNTKRMQEAEDKRMIESLVAVKSFNDKRLEIEKKYQEMRKSLGTVSPEQEQIIQQKESKDISKLAVDELQQSEAWALLFSDLDRLTISQIDKLINEIETRFDDLSVNFDPIDLSAIRQKLQEAREEIINQNPFKAVGDSLANIFKGASEDSGQSTQEIKQQWRNLSKATDKSFEFINDAVNSTAFLKDALGETGAASIGMLQSISLAAIGVATAIKSAEKASVILAVIQAALVAMQAVFSFLDSGAKRRNEELKKEQEYYNVLSDTFDILIDKQRKLFEEKNGKGALKAYEEALELVGAKQVANRKSLEAWFSQGASWNSHSNWYKYDRDLGNLLSRQKLLNMTGKEWEDLLRNQPELWARLPQEVRSYAQSVVDAKEETEDLKKTIQEALTGVSLDDLRSEFESLASNANLTFEDISKSFYKNMQKAVLRLIQDDKFTSDMKNWYDNLLRAMDDDNITEAESNLLKEQYKSIAEAQNARYKAIMDVIGGSDAFADDSQLKAESGIERITEQTATELMGITRAQYDVSKQHLLVAQKSLDFDSRANDMLIQSLKHQAAIEQNTASTVDQLKLVVEEIKTTNRNLGGKYGG